jgi:UDP-3-O-[3-hydroxymyristoyl] glucosamine N-acyltransferase
MPDGVTQEILERRIEQVSASRAAGPTSLVFAEDEASFAAALASGAGAILTNRKTSETEDDRVLRTADPRYAFALCGAKLRERAGEDGAPQIHASASVDGTAKLGRRVRVDAGAVVEAGVVLGDDVQIGSNAVVREGAVLGNRVVVQAGAVLGSLGFGYVRHAQTGEYLLFPQQGELVIEDDVEIGANTTIDRGALEETRIGRGTKIDNLVHIGHNCRIGKHVVIAAQVGISGSCVVEDGAILAGQVGISDHCQIGPGVILGGQAGVYRGKSVEGPGEVFSGTPAEPLREHMKSLARLRRLR